MTQDNIAFVETLETLIRDRLANPTDGSYTAKLANAGIKRIAQKLGEEAVELAIAAVDGNRGDVINEAADLVYHLLVLLNVQEISLADVAATLEHRHTR